MGLKETGSNIYGKLIDWSIKQPVVFHHVPKCGGTSVGNAVRMRYLLSQDAVRPNESFDALRLANPALSHADALKEVRTLREQMFLYLLLSGVRCVSSHVRFSNPAFDKFSDRYKFVTLLRDPVDRYISHYYYSHNRYKSLGREKAHASIPEPLDEFVETERGREYGAMYSEYFSGLCAHADFTSDAAVQAATDNLDRMSLVGFLDDVPKFSADLSAQLGVRLRVGHDNKAVKRKAQDELKPELLAKITAICAPDQRIYDHCRARYGLSTSADR